MPYGKGIKILSELGLSTEVNNLLLFSHFTWVSVETPISGFQYLVPLLCHSS